MGQIIDFPMPHYSAAKAQTPPECIVIDGRGKPWTSWVKAGSRFFVLCRGTPHQACRPAADLAAKLGLPVTWAQCQYLSGDDGEAA
jgi:hypothetical protein